MFIPQRFGFYLHVTYLAKEIAGNGVGEMWMCNTARGSFITEHRTDICHIEDYESPQK